MLPVADADEDAVMRAAAAASQDTHHIIHHIIHDNHPSHPAISPSLLLKLFEPA